MHARTIAAISAGKLAALASRTTGRGGGTAIAGLVAEHIDPRIVHRLVQQAGHGAIAVTGTNGKTTPVLNADDPAVAHLGRSATGRVVYYGVDDTTAGGPTTDHASDFRTCLECGAQLSYSISFYGHVGHWRCPSCGNARPSPNVAA